MLPKTKRLTKRAFDTYFRSGKRYHSPHLQLIYTPAPDFHGAVVVGKKVFKQAVKRNAMRRRLYGVLYRYSKQTGATGVFIIIAKPAAKNCPRRSLLSETHELLQKVT